MRCSDNTLYTGVTTEVARRISEHNSANRGAKYTRSRRPVELIFCTAHGSRSAAMKVEAQFKKLSRRKKLDLLKEMDSKFHTQDREVQVGDLICYKGNVLISTSLHPRERIGVVLEIDPNDAEIFSQARVKFVDGWGEPDDIWISCNRLLVYK